MEDPINKDKLKQELLSAGCLKYGEFTLKSGAKSDYYVDLRESTLHLNLFKAIVDAIKSIVPHQDRANKAIAGVPYGVVPVASVVAYECGIIYYPVRKEVKDHGRQLDASVCSDHEFILIEDVMSSGASIVETLDKLEGKKITDVIVVVDRESGGAESIKTKYPEIKLHSILRASEIRKSA